MESRHLVENRAASERTREEETEAAAEVHGSRRCYRKVVMVEEWKYDTMETCNHSYDKVGGRKGWRMNMNNL